MALGALLMLAQPVAIAAATSTAEKSVFLINIGSILFLWVMLLVA
jgi:hypothetical protein|tara:strand:- start:854 stop:988 length:135 start_codon:yes stop_codon:yes gene_type:complete